MRVRLVQRSANEATITLAGSATLSDRPLRLHYPTRTGALLRVDGVVRGAFDGKHATIDLAPIPGARELELQVERRALPIAGLPSGDGFVWRWMLLRETQSPSDSLDIDEREAVSEPPGDTLIVDVPLVGHAHLDVAWLWTYDATRRKALRTFATAVREIELDPSYVFSQSQPQLYAWVRAGDRALFDAVRARLGAGWDASVASMWVEPDLHAPSGESVLRQFAHGIRWAREHLGIEPSIAWLPDTFGFPATFPTLATHAGVSKFATTKLQWNETTRWAHPRFRWLGDDGSGLISAVFDSYDGDLDERRLSTARERDEILVVGYGDGGGGATDAQLARVAAGSRGWTPVDAWMDAFDGPALPEYRGELYLETHRGTYTTHHDVKTRNAQLERTLAQTEELAAWCVAVRAPQAMRKSLVGDLRTAWQIVLRGQFHDVISGSSITPVYADVHADYDRAAAICLRVSDAARSVLPRSDLRSVTPSPCPPVREVDAWSFGNAWVRAQVRDDGTVVALGAVDGPNLVAVANRLTAYVDRPRRYDAWNIDAGYVKTHVAMKAPAASLEDGALVVRREIGKSSRVTMRIALLADEPWLRVELAVAWHDDHVLLRAEHRVALHARTVRYGQAHGTIVRTAYAQSDAERAQFEVPAQRWAHVTDGANGLAVYVPDLYGWNGVGLPGGGVRLGTSLLRSPTWPDPRADRGEQQLAYALVPTAGASISALEHGWIAYTEEDRVRLFTCEDASVLIVATYPSDDGGGVIVRVRECDGEARTVALRCGGRMREAIAVDAVERPVADEVAIVEEELVFALRAFALRSFLVRF